jgi:hypothetical protein
LQPLIVAFILSWLLSPDADPLPELQVQHGVATENRVALSLIESDDFEISQSQLDRAASAGISLLYIDNISLLDGLSVDRFHLLYQVPYKFPANYQLTSRKSDVVQLIVRSVQAASRAYPNQIAAISLYQYPNEFSTAFTPAASAIADSVQSTVALPLFYLSAGVNGTTIPGIDFVMHSYSAASSEKPVPGVLHFRPSSNTHTDLKTADRLLRDTNSIHNSLIVLPANWVFHDDIERSDLLSIVSEYVRGNYIQLPLPREPEPVPSMNWNVLLLFLILGSLLFHIRYQPTYLHSLSRYFFNHTFFVEDVMEHRIRSSSPGWIILFQHAFVAGIVLYLTAYTLVSDLGFELLAHYFPAIFWTGNHLLSLFMFGFGVTMFLQVVSILWIHLLNRELRYFSQTLNLYSWPLHLNFILATLLIVLAVQGQAEFWVFIFLLLFGLVWFMSFNLAAIDAARYLYKYKLLYVLFTAGLHILLVTFLAWFLLHTPAIIEPIQMAISFN